MNPGREDDSCQPKVAPFAANYKMNRIVRNRIMMARVNK